MNAISELKYGRALTSCKSLWSWDICGVQEPVTQKGEEGGGVEAEFFRGAKGIQVVGQELISEREGEDQGSGHWMK